MQHVTNAYNINNSLEKKEPADQFTMNEDEEAHHIGVPTMKANSNAEKHAFGTYKKSVVLLKESKDQRLLGTNKHSLQSCTEALSARDSSSINPKQSTRKEKTTIMSGSSIEYEKENAQLIHRLNTLKQRLKRVLKNCPKCIDSLKQKLSKLCTKL